MRIALLKNRSDKGYKCCKDIKDSIWRRCNGCLVRFMRQPRFACTTTHLRMGITFNMRVIDKILNHGIDFNQNFRDPNGRPIISINELYLYSNDLIFIEKAIMSYEIFVKDMNLRMYKYLI